MSSRKKQDFWTNKRVCVTGGAGFLGRHVVSELYASGCRDVFTTHVDSYDLRRRDDVERMYQLRPDIVIHLAAAVGGLGANIQNPGRFFYDNAIMGLEMLDVARCVGVEKFIQMGSACEYPLDAPIPLCEKDIWFGYPEQSNAPYGIAKRMLLTQGWAYRKQYGMNVIHILSTNLYGPGDNFNLETSHVIAALVRKCIEAKQSGAESITVWGSGQATRDFLFVRDAAENIVRITESYNEPEPINLGSGCETSIQWLAEMIRYLVQYNGKIVFDHSKPDGQPRRFLDISRAKSFGITSETSFEQGLRETIDWYLNTRK